MKRITEQIFKDIKNHQKRYYPDQTMRAYEISWKTYIQIKSSKDFKVYTAMNKSQHPDVKFSLAEHVIELHKLAFKEDNTYIPPKTAKTAVIDLINTLKGKKG